MKPTNSDEIEKTENECYLEFLTRFLDYAKNPKQSSVNGTYFKSLVAAAGVVAKQKQTRSAMTALEYQIRRDTSRGLLNPLKEIPANVKK